MKDSRERLAWVDCLRQSVRLRIRLPRPSLLFRIGLLRRPARPHAGQLAVAPLQALLAPIGPGPLHGLARALEGVRLLCELGRRTLVSCGTEDFTKLVLSQLLIVFGLKLQLIHPLDVVLLYSFVALCVGALAMGTFLEAHAPRWSALRGGTPGAAALQGSAEGDPASGLFARAARFWKDSKNG